MRKVLLAAALIAAGAIFGSGADARTWGSDASRDVAAGTQVAQLAPAAPANRPANARPDLSDKWLDAKGQYRFPPDDGFWSPPHDATLAPGTVIDRYGFPGGRFLSPVGTSYEARALPYDKAKMPYYRYEVLKLCRPRKAWRCRGSTSPAAGSSTWSKNRCSS